MTVSQGFAEPKPLAGYQTHGGNTVFERQNVVQVRFLECAFQASKTNALSVFQKLGNSCEDSEGY